MKALAKILVFIVFAIVFSSCCPQSGVDKSFSVTEYPVAVDYYSQGQPVAANLVPKSETYVELVDANNQFTRPLYVQFDDERPNRVYYFFGSNWNTEDIRYLNVKLSSFEANNLDFTAVEKASFQREPRKMDGLYTKAPTYLERIECALHAVTGLILPRANAMSCRASSDSRMYYREGTLVRMEIN